MARVVTAYVGREMLETPENRAVIEKTVRIDSGPPNIPPAALICYGRRTGRNEMLVQIRYILRDPRAPIMSTILELHKCRDEKMVLEMFGVFVNELIKIPAKELSELIIRNAPV